MNAESDLTERTRALCRAQASRPDALIEILHDIQEEAGFIPRETIPVLAEELNLSRADVHGVASFYHDFRDAPPDGPIVKLCRGEACQAMGCDTLAEALEISPPESDGVKSVIETVYCLGNCALGPAAMVSGQLIGRANKENISDALNKTATRKLNGANG